MNSSFPFEPQVRVGLCEGSGFCLLPHGPYRIEASQDSITYTPAHSDSFMEVKGMTIGKKFHWQQERNLSFKGVIQLRRTEDQSLLLNIIKAEDYLKSVISSEMSADSPLEYLKAHAIISRSWLLRILAGQTKAEGAPSSQLGRIITFTQSDLHKNFDVCADDHCQRYQGISEFNTKVIEAVEQTRGLVLMDSAGFFADTRFSKCCGGHTELFSTAWSDNDFEYLPAKECEFCDPSKLTKEQQESLKLCLKDYDSVTEYFRWQALVTPELIAGRLQELYNINIGDIKALKPLMRGVSGRIKELEIVGSSGKISIGKELAIRQVLSETHLLSSAFDISVSSKGFLLTGRGWGHGVGLCQTGAAMMAIKGFSASEILQYYYPHTSLSSIYD